MAVAIRPLYPRRGPATREVGTSNQLIEYGVQCGPLLCPVQTARPYPEFIWLGVTFGYIVG